MKKISIISLLIISGCASAIQGNTQQLNLRTEPDVAATCQVKGKFFNSEVTAPGTITVKRSYFPLDITCTPNKVAKNLKSGSVRVISDVSNWGYGGAVLGVGIGAGVDAGTGAAFEYPANIVVTLGESRTIGLNNMNSNADFNR